MSKVAIPEGVRRFIDQAAEEHGRFQAQVFGACLAISCRYLESPIEQLFMAAIHRVASAHAIELHWPHDGWLEEDERLQAIAQWPVGRYRADFALRGPYSDKIVCVELDGHDFHDRDERQRRYEKRRDRFFTARGYAVLHFTGAEVVADPVGAVYEALGLLGFELESRHGDNP